MPISISDSDITSQYSTARPNGPLFTDRPFVGRGDSSHIIVSQEHVVTHSSYSPLALNSPHPVFTSCVYVGDTNFGEKLGGLKSFTRQWASIPASYSEPTSVSYTMPGVLNVRDPFNTVTKGIYYHEFLLVGSGETYATFDAIPASGETKASYASSASYSLGAGVYLNAGGAGVSTSTPSTSTYVGWMTADSGNATSYSITAEPSYLERYMGNIWERTTLKIKAA